MSVAEASQVFGIGKNKLYAMVRSQPDIPIVRIGEIKKINADLFSSWLDKCTKEGREL